MERHIIMPNSLTIEEREANNSTDAIIDFAEQMDGNMGTYFTAVPTDERQHTDKATDVICNFIEGNELSKEQILRILTSACAKNKDVATKAMLSKLASFKPEDVDLSKESIFYTTIRSNFEVAETAEYIEENYDVTTEQAFELATQVREKMSEDDSCNTFEGTFVDEIAKERGIKKTGEK